jgi:hypothetical protein
MTMKNYQHALASEFKPLIFQELHIMVPLSKIDLGLLQKAVLRNPLP